MPISLNILLLIAFGGALGAIARFGLVQASLSLFGNSFAYGTLSVNIIGSFVMGIVAVVLLEKLPEIFELRALIIIGFLGSFTTFSAFSLETLQYLQAGEISKSLLNILANLLACLLAIWLGFLLGKQLI